MEEGVSLFATLDIARSSMGGNILCCTVIGGALVLGGFHFRRRFLHRITRGNRISFSDLGISN